MVRERYDIVIIGSGIGGSTLAFPLARIGAKVLVVEKSRHPRFAIGESTIPSSTFMWRRLHEKYNVPEYINISHYLNMKETGLAGHPKAGFWFGLHSPGEELKSQHELQLETLKLPLGPDVHMLRSDVDSYMVSRFPAYGIDYIDETMVVDFDYDATEQLGKVTLIKDGVEKKVQCRMVADASGHRGFFCTKYNLLQDPDVLKTNSRALFGHFKNVAKLEEIYKPNEVFRMARDGETQHHCFDGGWIWVIPFDNGITSVGFMLDPAKYPEREDLSPEEEMREIARLFPSVYDQLKDMEAVSGIIRSKRAQFKAKKMVGDGWVLTPHAAGFVEAIFSTGLAFTAGFVSRFVPVFKKAMADNDFSADRFQILEDSFFRELKQVDLLVSASIESFRDYDVMKQVFRWWATCNMFHFFTMVSADLDNPEDGMLIFGAAVKEWRDRMRRMNAIVFDPRLSNSEAAQKLKEFNDEIPNPFNVINTEIGSDSACLFTMTNPHRGAIEFFYKKIMQEKDLGNGAGVKQFTSFISKLTAEFGAMKGKYATSKLLKTDFSKQVDAMHKMTVAKHAQRGINVMAPFDWI